MMYYVTRESFIRDAAQRYMQQAIDWQTGECSFDNAEFIALLETVGQITEHPETTEFTGYVPPEEELRTGKTYIETVRVANVAKLSEFEKAVGQELSFVGMPMPDGSNGSVMDPSSPVGVFAGSEKPEGCREFVKYLLLSYDMSYHRDKNSALPMYRPYLEKLEAEAVSEGRMTAEDSGVWLTLIGADGSGPRLAHYPLDGGSADAYIEPDVQDCTRLAYGGGLIWLYDSALGRLLALKPDGTESLRLELDEPVYSLAPIENGTMAQSRETLLRCTANGVADAGACSGSIWSSDDGGWLETDADGLWHST